MKTEEVVREVLALAAERPDHRYIAGPDGCMYFEGDEGQPGCIMGHAFARLGYGPEDVTEHDSVADHVYPASGRVVRGVRDRHWLAEVQERQDLGATWGGCRARG